jgi:aminoglycoside/choline kinase family phosphotransferase
VAFYTQLAQHSPIRTPRLLHADLDMSDHSFVLLLEDMGGATLGDQIAGLTPPQAEAAITAIGRLHGAWWGKVDSGGMDAVFDFANPQYGAAVQASYQGFLAPALSGFADCYSDYTKKTAEGLAPVAARVIKDQSSSGPRTFLHGDYRADNLLFGPGLGDDGIAAVDWQISGRGGPLYDVAYLICNSVPTAYRQQAEKTLLRRYHDTLLQMGVEGFSFDDCWQAYRFAVLCGLFVAVFTSGGMGLGNQRGEEMVRAVVRRVDAAVSELQVGDLLPG